MALRYGSENPESAAFVRRSVEPERRSKSSSKKGVIAAVGASVLAGSALLAYQSERSGTTSLRTATTANGAPTSNLAANFDVSSYQVPSFLQGDREIVIFPGFKPGLCMDDGGARKTALSAFTDVKCRAESVNQVFVFDEHNLMFRSAKKPNLCLSDGGATKPGDGPAHMAICDPSSPDQRFIYDEGNIQIRNPLKDLCLDDGGATTERETTYRMEKCDPENQNQVFSILWQNEAGGPVDEYHEDEETPAPTEGEPAPTTYSEPAPTEGEPAPTTYSEPEVTEGEPAPTTYSEPAPTEGEPAPTEYSEPSPTEEAEPVTDVIYPEPTKENEPFTLITPHMPGENGAGIPPREYLDQPSEQPHPVDPAHPNPKYTDFTDLDGDWNLLAPSDETIGPVNADSSDDISSEEIYTYLLGIKTKAEKQYEVTMSKYRRTYKCVTAGLQDFAKTSLTADEYHSLVRWMYQHCAFDGPTPGPVPDNEGSSSEQEDEDSSSGSATSAPTTPAVVDRVYMTKLEFYQEIKDHFAVARDELFGQGEATRLRSEVAAADRKKLLACIEEASTRFGREKEYELPEHFHNAILWVNNECMNTP